MDNLTHSLSGVLLARAGFNRYVRHAVPLLVLAVNAPDIDVISYAFGGAESYLEYHRGITHAIISTPVVALLAVLIVRLFARKHPFEWLRSWIVALVGVGSHWLLDFTNAYRIRLALPFNAEWSDLSVFNVVDLWIWAIFLFATLWPMLARLVSSEMGARERYIGRGWAITALSFVLLYGAARWFLHQRAVEVQLARIYNGEQPRRVLALPTFFNPFVWRGIVETGGFWALQTVNLREDLDPTEARILFKPETSRAIEAARREPAFQTLERFSNALLWRSEPASEIEGGTRVEAVDLRFSFTATALVDATGRVHSASVHF